MLLKLHVKHNKGLLLLFYNYINIIINRSRSSSSRDYSK